MQSQIEKYRTKAGDGAAGTDLRVAQTQTTRRFRPSTKEPKLAIYVF